MPVWRPHREWLRTAVTSALADGDAVSEVVVVDDGNEETVVSILEGIDDGRLRHVRIAHAGVSAARNAGTEAADGTHLRYVDADDVVEHGSSARLTRLAGANCIAHEATIVCDDALRPTGRVIASDLEGAVAEDCALGRFDVHLSALLFPRRVVDAAGQWDERIRISEDWDFVLRCLEHAEARAGPDAASRYRRHGRSATADRALLLESHRGGRRVLEKYFERHPEARGTPFERAAWTNLLVDQAGSALWRGRYDVFALRTVALARRSRPAARDLAARGAAQIARRVRARIR